MNIQPEPIIISPHRRNRSEQTAQHTATKDQIPQQTDPLLPGKTRVYPFRLADTQVPVLDLTNSTITSQADLQTAFQSLHLCSIKKRQFIIRQKVTHRRRRYPLILYQIANPQKKKQVSIYIHLLSKDHIILLKHLHKPHKWH